MKELHLNHYSTVNTSFEDDSMTALSRYCCGKNTTIVGLLDTTFCLLSLRTEAINPTVFPILLASWFIFWPCTWGRQGVCGAWAGWVLPAAPMCCWCINTFQGTGNWSRNCERVWASCKERGLHDWSWFLRWLNTAIKMKPYSFLCFCVLKVCTKCVASVAYPEKM